MARYYESEALIEFVKQNTPHMNGETTMKCVEFAIKNATTADVVEVVRCKDCSFVDGEENSCGDIYCRLHDGRFDKEAYCSYGERK